MKNKLLSAVAAAVLLASPVTANAERSGAWTGVDLSPDSYYIYLGAMTALQGQDINAQNGWLLRADVGFGGYDYDTLAVPGGNVDGDSLAGDLLVGYRHHFNPGSITAWLGGSVENHDQSPRDPGNSVEGTEGGVKGGLELNVAPANNWLVNLGGFYSTGFDSYWTRGAVGYNFGPVTVGPELLFLGNEEFHQVRYGAFLGGFDLGYVDAKLYGGYADTTARGDDGIYGGVSFGKNF